MKSWQNRKSRIGVLYFGNAAILQTNSHNKVHNFLKN